MPLARKAAGSAAVTSPSPPLLTHGGISGDTNRTRSRCGNEDAPAPTVRKTNLTAAAGALPDAVIVLAEHVGRDQGHPARRHVVALAIGLVIDADPHAVVQHALLVDDGALEDHVAPDLGI